MPKSNVSYPFESKMLHAFEQLSHKEFGSLDKISTFVIELDEQAEVLNSYNNREHTEFNFYADWQVADVFHSYIFFDEIDSGEYLFIKWQNLSRENAEKLLNISFTDDDFISFKNGEEIIFPESHNVMF